MSKKDPRLARAGVKNNAKCKRKEVPLHKRRYEES